MTRWQHNGNTFVGAGGGAGRAGLVSLFPKASSMLGFSFSCLTAWGANCFERWCADGVSAREKKGKEGKGRKRKAADDVGAREWVEMGAEKSRWG